MNCSIFEKKLCDLIENNISNDLKYAMIEHTRQCEKCNILYEEELSIEETFKSAFSTKKMAFSRSRGDIMKNIDKNKYGKSPVKKSKYHLKRHLATYIAAAAVVIAVVTVAPKFFNTKHDLQAQNKIALKSSSGGTDTQIQNSNANTSNNNKTTDNNASSQNSASSSQATGYAPKFEKSTLSSSVEPNFNTPWEKSPSGNFTATVEGKGPDGIEEGMGKIYVDDLKNGSKFQFQIVDNSFQDSPKNVKWVDDNNLLVIVGPAFGSISQGGALYLLNINTSKVCNADPTNSVKVKLGGVGKEEFIKVLSVSESQIKASINVFDDTNYDKSHVENRTISFPFEELKKYVE